MGAIPSRTTNLFDLHRWTPLRYNAVQQAFFASKKRFNVVPAPRRSGKTELAKRRGVLRALCPQRKGYVIFAAPVYQQAKDIYWNDVKALLPKQFVRRISESELEIELVQNVRVRVTGLDKPQRVEGIPIGHIVMDEYANMKADAWSRHVRPGLSDTLGTADFIGVPEGRNHYYDMFCRAQQTPDEWSTFQWKASDILAESELAAAKAELDELTFRQEYEAEFLTFTGQIYYNFQLGQNTVEDIAYRQEDEIVFCFDFNAKPGSVVCLQENVFTGQTEVISEVFIPGRYTNIPELCELIFRKYGEHRGNIVCAGDPSGGTKHISQLSGTAWEQIKACMYAKFGGKNRITIYIGYEEIAERVRINAMNARCKTMDGTVGLVVSEKGCPNLIKDFHAVTYRQGASEIDKKSNENDTHLTEALAFYVARRHKPRFKTRDAAMEPMYL